MKFRADVLIISENKTDKVIRFCIFISSSLFTVSAFPSFHRETRCIMWLRCNISNEQKPVGTFYELKCTRVERINDTLLTDAFVCPLSLFVSLEHKESLDIRDAIKCSILFFSSRDINLSSRKSMRIIERVGHYKSSVCLKWFMNSCQKIDIVSNQLKISRTILIYFDHVFV